MLKQLLFILFLGSFFANSLAQTGVQINPIASSNFKELKNTSGIDKFVKKAQSLNIDNSKITAIIEANKTKNEKINQIKALQNSDALGIIVNENSSNSLKGVKNEFKEKIHAILNFQEYQQLFEDQFINEITRKTQDKIKDVENTYFIEPNKLSSLENYIRQYVKNEVLLFNYYSFDNDLAKKMLRNAEFKYDENAVDLFEKKLKSFDLKLKPLESRPNKKNKEQQFKDKALSVGVTDKIAERIIKAAQLRDQKILEIKRRDKKVDNRDVYLIESGVNSRKTIKNNFKKTLSELITIEQFGKLFADQLDYEIDQTVNNELEKIYSAYDLNTNQQTKIKSIVKKHMTKKVLATHYYSFDNNVKKKKLKVVKFKYETEYKKLIKQYIN